MDTQIEGLSKKCEYTNTPHSEPCQAILAILALGPWGLHRNLTEYNFFFNVYVCFFSFPLSLSGKDFPISQAGAAVIRQMNLDTERRGQSHSVATPA